MLLNFICTSCCDHHTNDCSILFSRNICNTCITGSHIYICNLRYDSDGYNCKETPKASNNKATVVSISVVVPVLVVVLLLIAYFIWREKRRPIGVSPCTPHPIVHWHVYDISNIYYLILRFYI